MNYSTGFYVSSFSLNRQNDAPLLDRIFGLRTWRRQYSSYTPSQLNPSNQPNYLDHITTSPPENSRCLLRPRSSSRKEPRTRSKGSTSHLMPLSPFLPTSLLQKTRSEMLKWACSGNRSWPFVRSNKNYGSCIDGPPVSLSPDRFIDSHPNTRLTPLICSSKRPIRKTHSQLVCLLALYFKRGGSVILPSKPFSARPIFN